MARMSKIENEWREVNSEIERAFRRAIEVPPHTPISVAWRDPQPRTERVQDPIEDN